MKNFITKTYLIITSLCLVLYSGSTVKAALYSSDYERIMKQDILSLMMAYPDYISDVIQEENGSVHVVMKSGKKVLYDDKREKSFEGKIANPDIQDMMEQIYPLSSISKLMDKNFDPGRCRVYPLLKEVYGDSKEKVQSSLKNVAYTNCQFSGNNKAAESLELVMKELIPMAKGNNTIGACIYPMSGTFNYRYIAGTNRLSPHAFGIAIDLARDNRDYWKWTSAEEGEKRIASYPKEIVEIFEKNNFIWGGKWGHFDILHFEYRPEIIIKARYFGDKCREGELWYEGVPAEDATIKTYIEKIEKAFK